MCLEPLPRLRGCETIDSGGHPLPPLQRCYENQIFFPKYEELEELESRCAEDLPRHQGRLHFQAGSRGGGGGHHPGSPYTSVLDPVLSLHDAHKTAFFWLPHTCPDHCQGFFLALSI